MAEYMEYSKTKLKEGKIVIKVEGEEIGSSILELLSLKREVKG